MIHHPVRTVPGTPADGSLRDVLARFERPAINLARRILRDEGLAEDVVQEVFLAFWRNTGAFDATKGSFPSWLMAAIHHKSVDVVRRESVRPRLLAGDEERSGTGVGDCVPDPAEEVCVRDVGARVREALACLPLPQREVLVLSYFGGYSQSEIAARTATPLGTVKTRSAAGMRGLRQHLAAVPAGPPPPSEASGAGARPEACTGLPPVPRPRRAVVPAPRPARRGRTATEGARSTAGGTATPVR